MALAFTAAQRARQLMLRLVPCEIEEDGQKDNKDHGENDWMAHADTSTRSNSDFPSCEAQTRQVT